jgi:hypothetical protein
MDLSKATKEQLYEIATNEGNRLIDRYAAAYELQERRKKDEIRRNRSIN